MNTGNRYSLRFNSGNPKFFQEDEGEWVKWAEVEALFALLTVEQRERSDYALLLSDLTVLVGAENFTQAVEWVRALLARVRELEGDCTGHLERANVEIARRERAQIAFTQSEQKRLILLDKLASAEAQVRALAQEREAVRQTIAEMRSAVDLSKQFSTPVADHQLILDWANQLEARDAARPAPSK